MNTDPFRNGLAESETQQYGLAKKPSAGPNFSEMMMEHVFWACNMNLWIIQCDQTN